MPKDFLGAEIEVGDIAVYVTSGRYTARFIVEVVEVRKKVKVKKVQQDRVHREIDNSFWVEGSSLCAVKEFKGNIDFSEKN